MRQEEDDCCDCHDAAREEIDRLRKQINDNAIRASGALAKQAEELGALRCVVKGAHGALTDAGSVVVPGTLEGDLSPAIRQLVGERDALRQRVEELERAEGHPIYCPECGQPGECACLGNWRERAEAAERQVEQMRCAFCEVNHPCERERAEAAEGERAALSRDYIRLEQRVARLTEENALLRAERDTNQAELLERNGYVLRLARERDEARECCVQHFSTHNVCPCRDCREEWKKGLGPSKASSEEGRSEKGDQTSSGGGSSASRADVPEVG